MTVMTNLPKSNHLRKTKSSAFNIFSQEEGRTNTPKKIPSKATIGWSSRRMFPLRARSIAPTTSAARYLNLTLKPADPYLHHGSSLPPPPPVLRLFLPLHHHYLPTPPPLPLQPTATTTTILPPSPPQPLPLSSPQQQHHSYKIFRPVFMSHVVAIL